MDFARTSGNLKCPGNLHCSVINESVELEKLSAGNSLIKGRRELFRKKKTLDYRAAEGAVSSDTYLEKSRFLFWIRRKAE